MSLLSPSSSDMGNWVRRHFKLICKLKTSIQNYKKKMYYLGGNRVFTTAEHQSFQNWEPKTVLMPLKCFILSFIGLSPTTPAKKLGQTSIYLLNKLLSKLNILLIFSMPIAAVPFLCSECGVVLVFCLFCSRRWSEASRSWWCLNKYISIYSLVVRIHNALEKHVQILDLYGKDDEYIFYVWIWIVNAITIHVCTPREIWWQNMENFISEVAKSFYLHFPNDKTNIYLKIGIVQSKGTPL